MKKKEKKLYLQQKKRYLKKIVGTTKKPRLSVFRSHRNIAAQLINDEERQTVASSSTLNKKVKMQLKGSSATKEAAFIVGEIIGKKAKEKNISTIVFDRGNRPYHGRIAEVARGARSQGLEF